MSALTLNIKNLQLRNDTAANWTTANPTLAKGELGIEIDTGKVKVGDGTTAWASLGYLVNTAASKETGTSAGQVPVLDANGKLASSVIPALAIGEVKTVTYTDSETVGEDSVVAFKGITSAESGDVAIVTTTQGASESDADYAARQVTNGDGSYIYNGNTSGSEAYSASNWVLLKTPGSSIKSVNGQTGPVVSLASTDLTDGSTIVKTTDTVTINCGGASQS